MGQLMQVVNLWGSIYKYTSRVVSFAPAEWEISLKYEFFINIRYMQDDLLLSSISMNSCLICLGCPVDKRLVHQLSVGLDRFYNPESVHS